ncbi:AraC family transcriptional regulator [Flagellimonas sp. S3867]|uniref:helix-turn-helix domain-containing protein n=1 Tax=Flagellimonas sp. S3867 TaxID=2768063 RepID=UPI001CC26E1C|nr:AraC family transcriptional regulator [Flagellimonas sp. S3867]
MEEEKTMVELIRFNSELLPKDHRRIRKYLVVWCSTGKMEMEIDRINFEIGANSLTTITSGQFHKFKNSSYARGAVIQFTLDFFCKDDVDIELIFQNGLFCHFDRNEVINIINHKNVSAHMDAIEKELEEKPYQYQQSVHSRVKLLLIEINRSKIINGGEVWKPSALFLKFLELVRADFKHDLPLKFYTDMLITTERKLNQLSKQHAGKTARQIIHGLIVSEAKRLFFYENLSVKEISHCLGFNDPFYFSNFFKRHTGISPKAFVKQLNA